MTGKITAKNNSHKLGKGLFYENPITKSWKYGAGVGGEEKRKKELK